MASQSNSDILREIMFKLKLIKYLVSSIKIKHPGYIFDFFLHVNLKKTKLAICCNFA